MGSPPTVDCTLRTAFRYSNYGTPFWARANTSPGRWHHAGQGATQYLALHPDGAWAELARAENLRGDRDMSLVRMPMWVARVSEHMIVDYSDFGRAEKAGMPADALIDDDYSRCQAEGERLRNLGFRGVLTPSAALPGVTNLTLFGPRIASAWGRDPRLASSVPTAIVAVGAPPGGLAARVRFFGQAHAEYTAHRKAKNPRR